MTENHKTWMKLDNAGKIYPAAKSRSWTALFRLSANLTEDVDPAILEQAQKSTLKRFPSFALKLKVGLFWYYLEHNEGMPEVQEDVANPCVRMKMKENNYFMFRVRYYKKRIAVEIFHALTDGTGGLCFLRTLVAEYLRIKYGANIPRDNKILDCTMEPSADETEDAFLKFARNTVQSRKEQNAYHIVGTDEDAGGINMTTGIMTASDILQKAKEKNVTLTEYLTAVMVASIDAIQKRHVRIMQFRKAVKICVPVNLRSFYKTNTMRNFASYINPGIEPRYGDYTFDEILREIHHRMGFELIEKNVNAKISTNVNTEKNRFLRLTPLFIKNMAMKISFNLIGDRKTSTVLSNLGRVDLPAEMKKYVTRFEFIIGPLNRNKISCAAITYEGKFYLNVTRTIKEPEFERELYTRLVKLGIPVMIESNKVWEIEKG